MFAYRAIVSAFIENMHAAKALLHATPAIAQRYAWKWFVPKNNHMSHRYSVNYGAAFRGHIHF